MHLILIAKPYKYTQTLRQTIEIRKIKFDKTIIYRSLKKR